jgi:FtsP/CotA-like multicopper oxidase with cupredoxin domain
VALRASSVAPSDALSSTRAATLRPRGSVKRPPLRVRRSEREPGTWLYHCHVETHMAAAGMIGIYQVKRS